MLELSVLAKDIQKLDRIREILVDLTSSTHILSKCNGMARRSGIELGIDPINEKYFVPLRSHHTTDQELLVYDWKFLVHELRMFTDETQRLIESQMRNLQALDSSRQTDTLHAQIILNKLTSKETESFNRFTILAQGVALIFIPIGCAYGILSMGGEFAPGGNKFWIFFTVAISLVMATIGTFSLVLWWQIIKAGNKVDVYPTLESDSLAGVHLRGSERINTDENRRSENPDYKCSRGTRHRSHSPSKYHRTGVEPEAVYFERFG